MNCDLNTLQNTWDFYLLRRVNSNYFRKMAVESDMMRV